MAAIKTLCNSLPAINTFFFFFFGQPARTRFNWWLHFLRLTVGTFSSFPHLDWTCTVDCKVTTQHYRLKTFSICWVSPLWSWMVCSGSCPLLWCWFFFSFLFFLSPPKWLCSSSSFFPWPIEKKKKKKKLRLVESPCHIRWECFKWLASCQADLFAYYFAGSWGEMI